MNYREIRAFTHQYTTKSDARALFSYGGTFVVYFAMLIAAIWLVNAGLWPLTIPLVIIHAFSSVRLYVLQHDCGHAALFTTRKRNDWAGRILSVFTLTPYAAMRHNHNLHHAHVGNLDHREDGEIYTMTLAEWHRASPLRRLGYRLYRNPLVLMGLGGAFTYFLRYRWPKNAADAGVAGVLGHNALAACYVALIYVLAGGVGVAIWGISGLLSGAIGVFLVYLQHNFEDTYWDRRPDLDPQTAALHGSSALNLGWWWDLGTGNIAFHDIHHFNPRIPLYNLRRCHFALDAHMPMRRIGWGQALASFQLKLWDEDQARLVRFPKQRQEQPIAAA